MDCPHGQPMARFAGILRQVEHGLQAIPRLGQSRRFRPAFRSLLGWTGHGIRHGRRNHCQGPPPRPRRKRGTQSQAIGRSKGGLTTKILALTDALGNLVRFTLLPGHRFDTVGMPPLIDGLSFGALIADTAFDSNAIIADLNERGAKAVIAQHPRRTRKLPIDEEMYKWRHLIENFFAKLKEFKRIAMRADKTDSSFAAIIHLAAAVINSR
jgi:transposase